jgi:hypothetical protein
MNILVYYKTQPLLFSLSSKKRGEATFFSLPRHRRHSYRLSYLYKPATTTSTANHMEAAITVITLEPSLSIELPGLRLFWQSSQKIVFDMFQRHILVFEKHNELIYFGNMFRTWVNWKAPGRVATRELHHQRTRHHETTSPLTSRQTFVFTALGK